jgi:hypothetical protein
LNLVRGKTKENFWCLLCVLSNASFPTIPLALKRRREAMPNGAHHASSSHHRTSSPHTSVLPRIPRLGTVGSAVGDRIPAYIPGFRTSAGKIPSQKIHVACFPSTGQSTVVPSKNHGKLILSVYSVPLISGCKSPHLRRRPFHSLSHLNTV